jgi:hypothetical protein
MQRFIHLLICAFCLTLMPITAQDDPPINTQSSPQTLTVWIPAPLISDTNSEAYQQLLAHTKQFSTDTNVTVEYRIKAVGSMGGIMSTIRSGSIVAPGALPHIALIRRSDLMSAQTPTLLQSLENLFSSTLLNDLNNALELGQIPNNDVVELFGLPYFVDVQHTVYKQFPDASTTVLTFEDVLSGNSLLLPAERNDGLNQIVYLQYLEAGGVPPRNDEMSINQNALQTVLEFYEVAIKQNLITPDILDYNSSSIYLSDFMDNSVGLNYGIFTSSEYLSMLQQDSNLGYATIPTSNGDSITTLNGWVWIMVTPDPTQQDLSVRYLNWLMQPEFHADLSRELNQLPAQQSARVASLPNSVDPIFIEDLLSNAILPLPESEGGTMPHAIQEALIRVINGEATAEEATLEIVEQFATD